MPTYTYPSKEAIGFFNTNRFSRWYKNGADINDEQGTLAFQRMNKSYFTPNINSDFKIDENDRLFTIGSCFARGLENALVGRGFAVESAAKEFNGFELSRPGVTGLGFMNKYTTHSILNEIKWALDPGATFPVGSIVEIGTDLWVDPHTNPTLKYTHRQETLERRRIISQVMSRIRDCRVIVLTLGLIETWHDDNEDVFLNMTPLPEMYKRHPSRYTFYVLNYEENRANLDQLYTLLVEYGHPDLQIVATVSPVPIMATFTDRDVVCASNYTKSLLRVVAEDWAVSHNNVHYFPGYEIAMHSKRSLTWTEDGRHVRGEAVQHVINLFTKTYY